MRRRAPRSWTVILLVTHLARPAPPMVLAIGRFLSSPRPPGRRDDLGSDGRHRHLCPSLVLLFLFALSGVSVGFCSLARTGRGGRWSTGHQRWRWRGDRCCRRLLGRHSGLSARGPADWRESLDTISHTAHRCSRYPSMLTSDFSLASPAYGVLSNKPS